MAPKKDPAQQRIKELEESLAGAAERHTTSAREIARLQLQVARATDTQAEVVARQTQQLITENTQQKQKIKVLTDLVTKLREENAMTTAGAKESMRGLRETMRAEYQAEADMLRAEIQELRTQLSAVESQRDEALETVESLRAAAAPAPTPQAPPSSVVNSDSESDESDGFEMVNAESARTPASLIAGRSGSTSPFAVPTAQATASSAMPAPAAQLRT